MSKVNAARLNYNGPRQIYCPNPILIAGSHGEGGFAPVDTVLRVPVPDSRTRVKITVMFVPAAGISGTIISGIGCTIWVAACDEDSRGGGGGRTIPVSDVEGTKTLPTAFPTSSGLLGYSREFVTSADFLEATIHLVSTNVVGAWVLNTQIQPDSVSLRWDEWDAIRREFTPMNVGLFVGAM